VYAETYQESARQRVTLRLRDAHHYCALSVNGVPL
jgi:hypothetical protein